MRNSYLASYPRSGNTYVRLLLEHHFGLAVPSRYGKEGVFGKSLTKGLNAKPPAGVDVFWKTHNWPTESWPTLLLVRDGRDTLVSFAHYNKRFANAPGDFDTILERAIVKARNWGKFYEKWLSYDPLRIIRFEDLMQGDTVAELEWALTDLTGERVCAKTRSPLPEFSAYQQQNPMFFRRGIVGAWKDEMTPRLQKLFWDHNESMMKRLGYGGRDDPV